MVVLEIKKHRENYQLNVFHRKGDKSMYNAIINNDPNKIAQILIDLWVQGFNIEKAVALFRKRMKNQDWMGI